MERPEINVSRITVGGDIGGFVFAAGCIVITLLGLPVLRPVMLASLGLAIPLAILLAVWHGKHPLHHQSLHIGVWVLMIVWQ